MDPPAHFLFPLFIGLILAKYNIITWELALLCGIMGVLIDLDHYAEHILHSKSRRFSLIAAWNNSERFHKFKQRSFIHHTRGALLITLILFVVSLFDWKISLAIGIAYYSHLLLDYVHIKKEKFIKLKIVKLYIKESHFEVFLDIVLLLGVLIIIFAH